MNDTHINNFKTKVIGEAVRRAKEHYRQKEYDRALKEVSEALALDKRNVEALYLSGLVKYELKKYETALEDLNAAHELQPDDEFTIYYRALVNFILNRIRDAYVDFSFLEDTKSELNFKYTMGPTKDALLAGVPLSEFKVSPEPLGSGSFGKVQLATWNGVQVALKTPLTINSEQVKNEGMTAMKLRHPNIVNTLALCKGWNSEVSIVMEYAPDGSLYDLLYKKKVKLTREQILKYARDVASGLAYLHKRRVIHRDLKSANILLFGELVKICDFGQSRFLNEKSVAKTVTGTFGFIAPEVLEEGDYNKLADVYSFGVVLFEMCTNSTLPIIGSEEARSSKISHNIGDQELKQLIIDCCKTDPQQRPTSQQCFERITMLLTAQQKIRLDAEEQCYTTFRQFLVNWKHFSVEFKHRVVSMFLALKYGGQEPVGTAKLLPKDFAFKEEFENIAKAIERSSVGGDKEKGTPIKSPCRQQ